MKRRTRTRASGKRAKVSNSIESFTREVVRKSNDPDMEMDGFEDYIDDAFDYTNEAFLTHKTISGIHNGLLHCSASTLPSQSILGFRRPTFRPSTTRLTLAANVPLTLSNFRFKNAVRLQVRQSLFAVFASNANPSDQDPLTEKSGGIKTDDAGQVMGL
ncbi:RNA-dependent RNA polymerase 1 [Camellia lanceoleosa]|uniref:RNA-dependent RNA polymerase 1 n=1 Tax=Camellia lanceoleosa TaxID=1840588 RepID=A0ACC0INN5_9ERIC|nr:RNA-dependent RNA polymerase 1 [Camellia lanceoleosa]